MSLQGRIEVECPQCGKKRETEIWRSINATVDPDVKQALLDGRVNVFHCPKCGFEAPIGIDLLYHDMDKQFWVRFYPFEWVVTGDLLKDFNPGGEWRSHFGIEANVYVFRPPHVVFDMGELVRYVVFRDRLFEQSQDKAQDDSQQIGSE
jgi:predicted RNA-binding Zn-ribbon protein involved in translation (DUF1610 family)